MADDAFRRAADPLQTEPLEDRFGGERIIPIDAEGLPKALAAFLTASSSLI